MESMPASRAAATVAATSSGECRRPSVRSSPGSKALAPIDSRVTPARRLAGVAALVGSGLTSSDTRVRPRARTRRERAR